MDSIRKPGYKVKTRPIAERKKRRSDLVIMWQSFWNVSVSILFECWLVVDGVWKAIKFYFSLDDQQEVRKWLTNYLDRVPDDFAASWRDGILLSTLLNKLQPGCCPNADMLDPSYGLRNLYHVFQILEDYFNITPEFTVEEVITCSSGSDSKLLELLLQLKKEADARTDEVEPAAHAEESKDKLCESSSSTNCVARGTGLMVGFVGRAANFIVFFESISDLDLVVEIKGPCDTICTERVTKRSPKKKQVLQPWKPTSVHQVGRSSSNEDKNHYSAKKNTPATKKENETRYIPLEYEVHSNRIYFAYMPLIKGQHQIKILSQGMHVSDSPYTVPVGPIVGMHKKADSVYLKSSLKCDQDNTEHIKACVRFQEPRERKQDLGKIIRRQVLRYIVKIDNKDIVVETDSINNLATSLLKMDYDFQKPPLNRRNSWGFVGDAERKVSVIRQFCVNVDDLEAQSARLHRSHSFSSNYKKAINSTSYECEDIVEQKKLETVTEGTVSNFETTSLRNSEELVYLNDNFENEREIIKNNNKKFPVDNNYISEPKWILTLKERFLEESPYKKNVVEDGSLPSRRNGEATLLFSDAVHERFVRIQDTDKLPNHLTSASEISGGISKQTNDDETTIQPSTKKDVKIKTSHTKDKLPDAVSDIKSYDEEESISVTQSTVLIENGESDDISHCNTKAIRKQNDIYNPTELDGSEKETFIEEKPFTKTDINTVRNKMYQKKGEASSSLLRNDSNAVSTEAEEIEEKPFTKTNINTLKNKVYQEKGEVSKIDLVSNRIGISQNNSPKYHWVKSQREYLSRNKINAENKRALKLLNKRTLIPSARVFRNRQTHFYQRPKTKFNLMSSFEQATGKPSNIKPEYNNKFIKSKYSMPNRKIENFTPSSDSNYAPTNNSERNSFVEDLKDYHFRNNTKVPLENHSKFLVNNLIDDNVAYHPRDEVDEGNEKKIATRFSARIGPKYRDYSSNNESCHTKINLNNKYSWSNSISDESGIQITPPIQMCRPRSDASHYNSRPLKSCTLVGLGQLNFKHFNPAVPNSRESLVKNRILQWEKTVETAEDNALRQKHKDTQQWQKGDITTKLRFWESVTKEIKVNQELQNELRKVTEICNDREEIIDNVQFSATEMKTGNNMHNSHDTNVSTVNNKNDIKLISNKTLMHPHHKKPSDGHLSGTTIFPRTQRSASDPGVSELSATKDHQESSSTHHRIEYEPCHQASSQDSVEVINETSKTSSAEYPSSSMSLLLDKSVDDDEDSSADLMDSSEDEYIDDEISESASTYWGDLSVMERLKAADSNEYRDLCRIVDGDFWMRRGKDGVTARPVECQVFGIATYFGYVAVKNRFQVLTKGAGIGNLSATLQGFGRHDVSYVSVRYAQKDVYEVTYQVMSPGLYLISVRWMENPIMGSPFLCKVTF